MEVVPTKKKGGLKWVQLLLKIAVTVGCLWYVSTKIDFKEAGAAVKKASWVLLFVAFLVYMGSKLIGAKRLTIYFKNIGIHLPLWQNIKLYWLGMFYNLFLPGAITGDAYKVVLLTRQYNVSYKKTAAAVLLDRFSGLLSLGLIVAVYSCFALKEPWIVALLITGAILAVPVLYFIIKKYFPDFQPGFWPAFFWGAAVQLTVLLTVYCILFALQIHIDLNGYIFIFLVAVAASVLPISVGGGLGVREFVIMEGAKYTGLDQHTALILSLLFYLITVAASLIGLVFVFKDPLSQKNVSAR